MFKILLNFFFKSRATRKKRSQFAKSFWGWLLYEFHIYINLIIQVILSHGICQTEWVPATTGM